MLAENHSLIHQPIEDGGHRALGPAGGQLSDLTAGERTGRPGESDEHVAIERRDGCSVRVGSVHVRSIVRI